MKPPELAGSALSTVVVRGRCAIVGRVGEAKWLLLRREAPPAAAGALRKMRPLILRSHFVSRSNLVSLASGHPFSEGCSSMGRSMGACGLMATRSPFALVPCSS